MKILLQCECDCNQFEISSSEKYAKCKRCGKEIYIKDTEFNFDFEEEQHE